MVLMLYLLLLAANQRLLRVAPAAPRRRGTVVAEQVALFLDSFVNLFFNRTDTICSLKKFEVTEGVAVLAQALPELEEGLEGKVVENRVFDDCVAESDNRRAVDHFQFRKRSRRRLPIRRPAHHNGTFCDVR